MIQTMTARLSGQFLLIAAFAIASPVFAQSTLKGHTNPVSGVAFSADGTRIASASFDHTVKVWDARPLTPDTPAEHEALGILDFLFAKPLSKTDALEYVRNSPTLRPQARQLALALAERYREESDPDRFHRASREVVRRPYLNAVSYHFALRQAETACRLAPQQTEYPITLGMAQYRAGQYPQALATLTQAGQHHAKTMPAALAFLAMTQHQLGQKVQALATFARLQALLGQPGWGNDEAARGLLHEAEMALGTGTGKP